MFTTKGGGGAQTKKHLPKHRSAHKKIKKNEKIDLAKHILISKKKNNFSKPKPISLNANQFHLHEFIIK